MSSPALLWLTGFLVAHKSASHHCVWFVMLFACVKDMIDMISWMIYRITQELRIIHNGVIRASPPRPFRLVFFRAGKMVKLGNNFSEKNNGKVVSEDGFDTIPLITPLDASQLQFPPPDKVRFLSMFPLIWRVTVRGPSFLYFYHSN